MKYEPHCQGLLPTEQQSAINVVVTRNESLPASDGILGPDPEELIASITE